MSSSVPLIAAYKGAAGRDVLTFARMWSQASGRPLQVVTVYPSQYFIGMGRTDAEWVSYNRAEAENLLAEAHQFLSDDVAVEYQPVAAESASRGLHDAMVAAGSGATVIVGSRKTRGVRRTALGSTAGRLLQGAPGPVTLVPWDYEAGPADQIRRVAVAFVDTPDGRTALTGAQAMATELRAQLTVIIVLPDTRVSPAMGEPSRFANSWGLLSQARSGTATQGGGLVLDVLEQVTRLALQHPTHGLQCAEPHRLRPAVLQHGDVRRRQTHALRELADTHLAPGQLDVDPHDDGHQMTASMSVRSDVACRSSARITIINNPTTVTPTTIRNSRSGSPGSVALKPI